MKPTGSKEQQQRRVILPGLHDGSIPHVRWRLTATAGLVLVGQCCTHVREGTVGEFLRSSTTYVTPVRAMGRHAMTSAMHDTVIMFHHVMSCHD